MLREIRNVRQVPGELKRRWFTSDTMDLIVWVDQSDDPAQIQLCYDKGRRRAERALTWRKGSGYTHTAVDDGEIAYGRYKSTPILVADSSFNSARVSDLFLKDSSHLPTHIVRFVSSKIQEYQNDVPHMSLPSIKSNTISPYDKPI